MSADGFITLKQLYRKPVRTLGLILLGVILSLSIIGGTLIISGLRSGLDSLEDRLGADIMVVPVELRSKAGFNTDILQGNKGYYYVERDYLNSLYNGGIKGIGQISEQYYFATASADCCTAPMHLISYDPKTDFTIKPWIEVSYKDELKDCEIVIGYDINLEPGDVLYFFGVPCTVAARMEQTGTYLDTAVYTTQSTIEALIKNAIDNNLPAYTGTTAPSTHVSSVLINVADGYSIDEVLQAINENIDEVYAVKSKSLITNVAEGLTSVSGIISTLIIVIWILSISVMAVAFVMIVNERKKEFAIIRVTGASEKMMQKMIKKEAFIVSAVGSILGAVLGISVVSLFSESIENYLDLPFLLPSPANLLGIFILAIAAATISGSIAASFAVYRISRLDPALILQEDN